MAFPLAVHCGQRTLEPAEQATIRHRIDAVNLTGTGNASMILRAERNR